MAGEPSSQAGLWSERARDWADVMEGWNGWGVPIYRRVLERTGAGPDTEVLDVGCGAGRFCRMAADRGARCSGIDTTADFVEIAGARVPAGDFRVGQMEELPWGDDSFDLVTGFNSFFIGNMPMALREARRVVRPGGSVAMTVFGRPGNCDSTSLFRALGPLMGMPDSGGDDADDDALHAEGHLEAMAGEASLDPVDGGYFELTEEYPDRDTMLRGFMAAPPFVRAGRAVGDGAVREALAEAIVPYELPDGRFRLNEELRYLIALG